MMMILNPTEVVRTAREIQEQRIQAAQMANRAKRHESISYEDLPVQQKNSFFKLPNPFSVFSKQGKLRRASQL
ncbi:MAG: hypothetical protein KC546_16835 [Anaerolineae bacterium]|nr:hypothetical protein [Anaerolineae bacterium]MCA9890048.1 hypothetical protein [Anaerolineae bacterium]MCB9460298.1 hypothetical protein [Anaerolineaceae bacterium]